MRKLTFAVFLSALFTSPLSMAQIVGLKTNLLYGMVTKTPNLGIEFAIQEKSTFEVWGAYNPWNLNGHSNNNKKIVHWIIEPEWKHWFCSAFNGHYIGLHGLGSHYNISQTEVPFMFDKKYRYQGYLVGGGVSYGYQWILGKRWNLEASIGFGGAYMNYNKYECQRCGFEIEKDKRRIYFGPTKANISVIYIIK